MVFVVIVAAVCVADHIDLRVVVLQVGLGGDLVLRQVFGAKGVQIDGDAFGAQLAGLTLQCLGEFLAAIGPAREI